MSGVIVELTNLKGIFTSTARMVCQILPGNHFHPAFWAFKSGLFGVRERVLNG